MRIAALYDIHANVPALEAVLQEVHDWGADQVVVGGDVVPGPMPRGALALLSELDVPVQFIHGNRELSVLAQIDARGVPHILTFNAIDENTTETVEGSQLLRILPHTLELHDWLSHVAPLFERCPKKVWTNK